ncbi:MAG: alanine racemase [marine benthic group bacterium]|nr:alanine racemase [Candidatus Benthicola marisminoris]
MPTLHDIPTPALALDVKVLEANLQRMSSRCKDLGVHLRPHVKTHKCVEIAMAQRALGARGITVSTLPEAREFADRGFDDLTWAFPVITGRIGEAAELARQVQLGVVADSVAAVDALVSADAPFRVWLKIDCGYGRAGVDPASTLPEELSRRVLDGGLELAGLLSHSGDAYRASSKGEMHRIAEHERQTMADLARKLGEAGLDTGGVSVGSTPSMTAYRSLDGVTEVRPGNYALHDYSQVLLGSCRTVDCAVTVVATVVSSNRQRNTSVVDAGALALSLDPGPAHLGRRSYGEVLDERASGALLRNARVTSLSQEHGAVSRYFDVGTRIRILPNHSCLTVACFDAFSVVQDTRVLDSWPIFRKR